MKKIALILLGICLSLGSCKPKDKTQIHYDGKNIIDIALLEKYDLDATSESELTFYSDNEMIVTVDPNGIIMGKNIGEANITIQNPYNSITVKVIVNLFEEPTLEFGCSINHIKSIYGEPKHYNDSILIYGSGNDWYSYAVWEMDFFFINNQYVESDLYIRKDLDMRLEEYLNKNFFYNSTVYNTSTNDSCYVYLNDINPENASVLVGKIYEAGPYDDICLFYIPYEHSDKSAYNEILNRNRIKR